MAYHDATTTGTLPTSNLNMAHNDSENSSPVRSPTAEAIKEKEVSSHIEQIHSNERVPGHPGYYEKDGLRTYGDDEDHDHEPPVRALSAIRVTPS